MGVLTILGGIFSSWRIYVLIGVAVAALGLFAYVEHLRADAAAAHAALSSAEATVNEAKSVIDTDNKTIIDLQLARKADEDALRSSTAAADVIAAQLAEIKDWINAIPEPKTCQRLDPRDRAAIDGVRRIINPPATHSN